MPWLPVLPIFLSINSFLWSQGLPVISWHTYLLNLLSASRMDKYHKKGCKSDIGATSSFFIKLKRKKKMNDGIKVLHGLKGICESCREMDFWLAVECSRNEHQEELESRISSGLWFGAQHYSEDQLSSFFHWVRAKWRKLGSKSTTEKELSKKNAVYYLEVFLHTHTQNNIMKSIWQLVWLISSVTEEQSLPAGRIKLSQWPNL